MASQITLLNFPNPERLAQAVAEHWVNLMSELAGAARFCVALSGGRITRRYFDEIARESKRLALPTGPLHFFWADERCVPPDHEESNYRLAQEHFLRPLNIPPDQVHRIRGEVEPKAAAAAAEQELLQAVTEQAGGPPELDLVLLGMGEDGHIASLFPNAPADELESGRLFYPVQASKPPPSRITMSYELLAAAKRVWVIISGQGKEVSLEASLQLPRKTPLGKLLSLRQASLLFSDLPVSPQQF